MTPPPASPAARQEHSSSEPCGRLHLNKWLRGKGFLHNPRWRLLPQPTDSVFQLGY
ncbi:hypothetical protein NHJ13734_009552, partial [Beauveria thailandica]